MVAVQCMGSGLWADEADKKEISRRLEEFSDAFNKANGKALSTLMTEDVSFTTPFTGETLHGRKEVMQIFEMEFPRLQGKKLSFIEKSVDFPSADKAIVQGASELTDKGVVIRRQARKLDLVKQNGSWYIKSIREIDVQLPPDVYSHLKELDWLIGNWHDKDENIEIHYATNWDKFKNFILQHFRIGAYGVEMMEGLQIIGWDPSEKKFRSWVYDSDGGFGNGFWSKKGDSWHVTLHFTLSDGEKGQATNIYTKRDDKSYTYSSIDREIGGKKLPNIESVTVVKED
jgi:ketosteroid isomerase-like protein